MAPLNLPTASQMRGLREKFDSVYDDLPRYEPIGHHCETCAFWAPFDKADARELQKLARAARHRFEERLLEQFRERMAEHIVSHGDVQMVRECIADAPIEDADVTREFAADRGCCTCADCDRWCGCITTWDSEGIETGEGGDCGYWEPRK